MSAYIVKAVTIRTIVAPECGPRHAKPIGAAMSLSGRHGAPS